MWASLRRAVRVARTWAFGGIAVALFMLNGSEPDNNATYQSMMYDASARGRLST